MIRGRLYYNNRGTTSVPHSFTAARLQGSSKPPCCNGHTRRILGYIFRHIFQSAAPGMYSPARFSTGFHQPPALWRANMEATCSQSSPLTKRKIQCFLKLVKPFLYFFLYFFNNKTVPFINSREPLKVSVYSLQFFQERTSCCQTEPRRLRNNCCIRRS